MSPLLEVRAVSFAFGPRAILESVSFEAEAGEFLALLGPNGAGKSTLLDLLTHSRVPDSGKIHVSGRPLAEWTPRQLAHKVSHLPQAVHADLPFTAEQLVGMGRYPHTDRWFESADDRAAIQRAMERTRCLYQRGRQFSRLSGGERQRVLLAACLAQEASVLLLDEPSTFLDVGQQIQCFELLREEARQRKLCVAVTHDLNLAVTYCTRILVLNDCRIAYDMKSTAVDQSSEWLSVFSPRLQMGKTPAGKPWIWHQ